MKMTMTRVRGPMGEIGAVIAVIAFLGIFGLSALFAFYGPGLDQVPAWFAYIYKAVITVQGLIAAYSFGYAVDHRVHWILRLQIFFSVVIFTVILLLGFAGIHFEMEMSGLIKFSNQAVGAMLAYMLITSAACMFLLSMAINASKFRKLFGEQTA